MSATESALPNDSGLAAKDPPKRRRALLILTMVFVFAALVWFLLWKFVFSTRESTDNAYVGGNLVGISAQVPGTVVAVLTDDTQHVDAGQVLVKLDPTDADVRLRQVRSALALAVRQVRANFRAAWVTAQRNTIVAPVSGYVAQRSVQLGNSVSPGQPLMSVVPLHQLWVDANFKENQLGRIRIGQPATITTDLYGGKVEYHGKVIGLGAGTGSVFSLLPAQNATGNWIKVVQRVPVRIALDDKELDQHPLRVGLSADVTVDVSQDQGAVLAAGPAQPAAETNVYDAIASQADAEADKVIAANLGK